LGSERNFGPFSLTLLEEGYLGIFDVQVQLLVVGALYELTVNFDLVAALETLGDNFSRLAAHFAAIELTLTVFTRLGVDVSQIGNREAGDTVTAVKSFDGNRRLTSAAGNSTGDRCKSHRSFVSRYNMRASSPFKMSEEMCRNAYAYERHGKINNSSRRGSGWRENPEMMCQLVRAAQSPASLDMEIETGRFLIDVLAEKEETKVEFHEDSFSPEVEEAIGLAELTAQENTIVRLAFLDGLKWPEINAIHPLSKNEFAAVKRSALNKLRLVVDPAIMGV